MFLKQYKKYGVWARERGRSEGPRRGHPTLPALSAEGRKKGREAPCARGDGGGGRGGPLAPPRARGGRCEGRREHGGGRRAAPLLPGRSPERGGRGGGGGGMG